MVTFGQPKVTGAAGAEAFTDLPLLRIVVIDDPVASSPRQNYAHFGDLLILLEGRTVISLQPGDPAYEAVEVPVRMPDVPDLGAHASYREQLSTKFVKPIYEVSAQSVLLGPAKGE